MKKFCNKISKQQWRVSVPNLNSTLFRRSASSPDGKSDNENSYNLNENLETSECSGSFLTINSDTSERARSVTNSTAIAEENEETDSDRESKYEDASPMYEKKMEFTVTESNNELDQNVYADVENSLNNSKDSDESTKFVYDIPKISFSFFEDSLPMDGPTEEYEVLNVKPRCSTPKLKSEVKIVLATPLFLNAESEIDLDASGEEINASSDKEFNDKSQMVQSQNDVSISESKCEISDPKTVEMDFTMLSFDDLALSNLLKCDSEPSVDLREEKEDDNDNDDDDDDDGLYKVPTKPYKRLSQSLNDFNKIAAKKEEESNRNSGCSQISRSQIIQHNVVLEKQPSQDKVDDNGSNLDYCNVRSQLPLKVRRATLLRRPQMRLKTNETWSNLRTKVSNIIATHSAAQRVGANTNNEKVVHLDQFYKNSRSKCKSFVKKSGKIFSRKRGQENVDPNIKDDSISDSSSAIVKNDAFFAKVDLKEMEECNGRDGDAENNEMVDKFGSKSAVSRDEERSDFDFSTLKSAFRRSRMITEGQNGFEDLRRFVKQGGDFCKELSAILQERSEAELQYAKSLAKLSGKLSRACRDGVGGLNEAWKNVATDMESRADAHRQFSSALCDDIVKPLKHLTEVQHKQRKLAEGSVDKTARGLSDWRAAEAKSKKQSHQCARDNEKLQDALLDVRLARSTSLIQLAHMHNHKALSDKESAKLEGKKRKAEDAVKKADIEYYTLCVRAERARLEWESAVLRGSKTFQSLEEERLNHLKSILNSYLNHSSEMCPKLLESTNKLRVPVTESESLKDMSAFINLRNSSQHVSEQLLPDFYCEHITLAMNRERRKQALVKLLHLIRQDLERERKSKNGLENLSRAIKQTPNFGAEDSQQNVTEKLYHMRSMLTYLEGARYKVQSALAELENRQRTSHPLAAHITITRDKSGLQQSILKVPQWLREEFIEHDNNKQTEICETEISEWNDRGMADGNSNQHDSDFDEFSSQGSSVTEECHNVPLGQCKALYAYTANLPDELNLQPGDLLSVYRKQEDGWWLGECNGCVGIFPATYVENV